MKITLTNGIELSPIIVTGERKLVHGVRRDTLSFVFPVETSLDEIDAIFTAKNCDSITITDDEGNEYIHKGYTVRTELCRKPVVVQEASEVKKVVTKEDGTVEETTELTEEVIEQRVMVSMAQRTHEETVLEETQAGLNALLGV